MPSKALKTNLTQANRPVPQTKKADPAQVPNSAGGFTFTVSDKDRLTRFLVLGTDGGTYYVDEQKITTQNVDFIVKLIKEDPELVLNTVVEVSHSGRAYRNSAAIFVLALMFKHASKAYKEQGFLHNSLPMIARTSYHLFELAGYFELLGGWSRSKRNAVAAWYNGKTPEKLAYQAVKYRQRDGWTHRDLFRLSHPKDVDQKVGSFILGKYGAEHYSIDFFLGKPIRTDYPKIIEGFELAQKAQDKNQILRTLDNYQELPWEAMPTQFHKEPELWKKLFANGQLQGQALLRQITRLAKLGMFQDMVFAREYADRLVDAEMIAKTRLHPIQYLLALIGHTEGQVKRATNDRYAGWGGRPNDREKTWNVSSVLVDALQAGFYQAFESVESANKRTLIGVDVSGSMSSLAMGIDLSCAQVAGAMAMTIARTEPYYEIRGFTAGDVGGYGSRRRSENELTDLGITPNTRLDDAMRKVKKQNFGSTDCSLPMEYAIQNNLAVDTFVVITDNETYAGARHPHVALQAYRKHSGIDAKLVVMGMTATNFTIADPSDRGMLDVCGADTSTPRLVADFSAGRI